MSFLESSFLVWSLGFVQFAGLISAGLARLSEGSVSQASCQWIFVAFLSAIGGTTMLSIALGPRFFLASGITLSVMVLSAIWDFRPHARPESR